MYKTNCLKFSSASSRNAAAAAAAARSDRSAGGWAGGTGAAAFRPLVHVHAVEILEPDGIVPYLPKSRLENFQNQLLVKLLLLFSMSETQFVVAVA